MEKAFFLFFVGYSLYSSGQNDTVRLDEIVVNAHKLKKYSKGYKVSTISDSIITRNNTSLTDILRFNTSIYFKEYGNGMLSSASFRGTSASQTTVIWNGININSQLNGQTDFNTLAITNLNGIDIRSGGGSVLFGSGVIGGSIHLNNDIRFKKQRNTRLLFSVGSYDSYITDIVTTHSNSKSFLNFGANITKSTNDYPFLNTDLQNDNAEYERIGFSGNFGVKINAKNWLKLYSNLNLSDRNTARSLNGPSRSKLKNNTFRNLLEWNSFFSENKVLTSRIAYLTEDYQYFENRFSPDNFSKNKANTIIANIDYSYKTSDTFNVKGLINYENVKGKGDNIQDKNRNSLSFIVSIDHTISKFLSYAIQVRQEFSSAYDIPFLYSVGLEIKPVSYYVMSLNTSKNFRVPTLNDLFWSGAGNSNLQPEDSYQIEVNNDFNFKNISFGFTGFYIKSNDLIQWNPNISGVWKPNNIAKAKNYGLETKFSLSRKINSHQLNFDINYALTFAKDVVKKRDLVYVPKHRVSISAAYQLRKLLVYYQQLINGKVAAFADSLPAYSVSNLGVNYRLNNTIEIEAKANNLFNKAYQNYQYYPMSPRNYQLQIQLNI